jgi:hypothetical protein
MEKERVWWEGRNSMQGAGEWDEERKKTTPMTQGETREETIVHTFRAWPRLHRETPWVVDTHEGLRRDKYVGDG